MPVVETFFGYVETTRDSLILLEACRQGSLPRVRRRLQEQERQLVKSGAVFCFDENESGIKRWTDGLVWSPSRILGNFLIYRELDDRKSIEDDEQEDNQLITSGLTLLSKRQRERALVGSLRNSYRFKPNGLIKKSMSIVVNGVQQHLVSYYSKEDVLANKFKTPSDIPELNLIEISADLLRGQNFRIPFFPDDDSTEQINKDFNIR
ncbi:Gti1/Pac2 family-domain-containing protein [Halteromyces radiatus]|uniref:Gti1/Pac2 family-domain-containing protein n=1 Tax=Halteromyces radiatus TaxID=101107 RepID=UPI00221F7CCB|nr:Gti1/Pac2 family-domain-containing protein [Halteromyces radiatus]KAI8096856.1 Gti1/Pac2 family-domain-containing protein [Halteromyces radiatus]